jgi:hypothetical protein
MRRNAAGRRTAQDEGNGLGAFEGIGFGSDREESVAVGGAAGVEDEGA